MSRVPRSSSRGPRAFAWALARLSASARIRASRRPSPSWPWCSGSKGDIVGYTLANDVSAWDIERENALYLPQSKVYTACCALGPVIVTADDLPDPYNLEMTCTVTRDGRQIFSGSVSTAKLHRKFETLIEYLRRANHTPAGTVLLTGTGIIVPEDAALAAGDMVSYLRAGNRRVEQPGRCRRVGRGVTTPWLAADARQLNADKGKN